MVYITKYSFTIDSEDVIDGCIDHVDVGMNTLIIMCDNIQLTSLPLWPQATTIHCCNNQLTKLPLWDNVTHVICFDNQLTSLPLWPSIRYVDCSDNHLTDLPLWTNVTKIYCRDNKFIYPPKISDTVTYISITVGDKLITDVDEYRHFYNNYYSQLIMIKFNILPKELIRYTGEFIMK